jgi:hypothetical protein
VVVVIPEFPFDRFFICFYDEEEIAKFRHDAFLEECGLDPEEFDE